MSDEPQHLEIAEAFSTPEAIALARPFAVGAIGSTKRYFKLALNGNAHEFLTLGQDPNNERIAKAHADLGLDDETWRALELGLRYHTGLLVASKLEKLPLLPALSELLSANHILKAHWNVACKSFGRAVKATRLPEPEVEPAQLASLFIALFETPKSSN